MYSPVGVSDETILLVPSAFMVSAFDLKCIFKFPARAMCNEDSSPCFAHGGGKRSPSDVDGVKTFITSEEASYSFLSPCRIMSSLDKFSCKLELEANIVLVFDPVSIAGNG